ncbi:MAG TPA: hypothetical protein VFS39_05215 [Nitrospira sp.]|nr:hypothetical protein [Nitrospira sp.]
MSQAALSLTDHVSVPPPVLLMLRDCAGGSVPPCTAEKEKLAGLTPIAGGTEGTGEVGTGAEGTGAEGVEELVVD